MFIYCVCMCMCLTCVHTPHACAAGKRAEVSTLLELDLHSSVGAGNRTSARAASAFSHRSSSPVPMMGFLIWVWECLRKSIIATPKRKGTPPHSPSEASCKVFITHVHIQTNMLYLPVHGYRQGCPIKLPRNDCRGVWWNLARKSSNSPFVDFCRNWMDFKRRNSCDKIGQI